MDTSNDVAALRYYGDDGQTVTDLGWVAPGDGYTLIEAVLPGPGVIRLVNPSDAPISPAAADAPPTLGSLRTAG